MAVGKERFVSHPISSPTRGSRTSWQISTCRDWAGREVSAYCAIRRFGKQVARSQGCEVDVGCGFGSTVILGALLEHVIRLAVIDSELALLSSSGLAAKGGWGPLAI